MGPQKRKLDRELLEEIEVLDDLNDFGETDEAFIEHYVNDHSDNIFYDED